MSIRDKYRSWRLRKHVEKFGSKNNGYFNYFNREWFEKHQNILIWLLNHWLLKFWFRWILRIHKDCKGVINRIEPNAYWFDARYIDKENIEVKTDFRTHNKFSKRIYYSFRPLWFLLHSLDWLIQRTVDPDFSFGFDTLTTYPDADPEVSTVDGYVGYRPLPTTWAIIRAASTGDITNSNYSQNICVEFVSTGDGLYEALYRSIFLFATSALTNDATIQSATISIYAKSSSGGSGGAMNLVASNPNFNTNIINQDFSQIFSTKLSDSNITPSSFSFGENSFPLNPNGLSNINKIGISKFGMRNEYDISGIMATYYTYTAGMWYITVRFADYTGVDNDPKLVVTYTLPVAGNKFQMVV